MATQTSTPGLTQAKIDRLKPGPARQEIADGRGLYLLLQPAPSTARSWAFRYRCNGAMRKLTFSGALSLADARKLADEARVAVAKGHDPQREKIQARRIAASPAKDDLIENVIDSYLRRHVDRKLRPSTGLQVRRMLLGRVIPAWKGRPIASITRRDVRALLESIVDTGRLTDANRCLSWTNAMMSWAISEDILTGANPCSKLAKPSVEQPRERALDDGELAQVWRAAEQVGGAAGRLAQLLIATGARRTEVGELTWSELDLDRAIWTLPASRSKNGREIAIPLNALALDILRATPRFEGCDAVVTANGSTPINGYSVAKAAIDRKLTEGFAGWRFHDLRRSFATGLAALGIEPHLIERLLNHSEGGQSKIARTYNQHRYGDAMRRASEVWATHIKQLLDGTPATNVVNIGRAS